ncbi:hypothetical protein BKA62DRAFT_719047 [Auriculariales sp. MPI-PUGE-AT-0066]|nr:hypothetical protein BKA62DRAFT_719047 [Auriculariales sp. MPI-PUGE-AT-0066]
MRAQSFNLGRVLSYFLLQICGLAARFPRLVLSIRLISAGFNGSVRDAPLMKPNPWLQWRPNLSNRTKIRSLVR